MKELEGKLGNATIYASIVEDGCEEQIMNVLNTPIAIRSNIAVMPDCHVGKGCTIGFTMQVLTYICPNLIGVDIGCGVRAVNLGNIDIDLVELDKVIKRNVPCGFNVFSEENSDKAFTTPIKALLKSLRCLPELKNSDRFLCSIGTLGGGNHFIELNRDEDTKDLWLCVHSGSRNLGLQVANYYQNMAINECVGTSVSNDLAYLGDKKGALYLNDMNICQIYADVNRSAIISNILKGLRISKEFNDSEVIESVHNYIEFVEDDIETGMILRKGAISAKKDEVFILPINMRDGSLICRGKGNREWNYSSPHGAGRILSRTQAKKQISLEDYKESMKDVYSTCVSEETLDECPMAYKDINVILEDIKPTAVVMSRLIPIYNFKASEASHCGRTKSKESVICGKV